MKLPIYLDYAATTPVDPRVAMKMAQYLTQDGVFGNPSSTHAFGQAAKAAVDEARSQVAAIFHADPAEIIWTSGATESINLALKGAAQLYKIKGQHIVTVKTEHPAVLDCCQELEKLGFLVTYLTPEKNGMLDLEKFQAALRHDTILVSIMHVNNEIGVIQDIHAMAHITAAQGILLHVDASQSAGKIEINLQDAPIDLLSISAHKFYGPKGSGILYLRRKPRVRVAAQLHGGGHEHGMRSGTLATHQIIGLAEALQIAHQEMETSTLKMRELRQRFCEGIREIKNIFFNTHEKFSIPNIMNIRFQGFSSEKIMAELSELAISAGSACHAKGIEPSYVLRALGQSREEAASAVRFSWGRFTTVEEIDFAIQKIKSFSTRW